jgi:hypothetical protein
MEPWNIEVLFVNDYAAKFYELERKDAEFRFCLAITKVIKETGITPQINDWIRPIDKNDNTIGSRKISGRDFFPSTQTIRFEIE